MAEVIDMTVYIYDRHDNLYSEYSPHFLPYIANFSYSLLVLVAGELESTCQRATLVRGCASTSCQCISSSPRANRNGPITMRPYSSSWPPSLVLTDVITVAVMLIASSCLPDTVKEKDSLNKGSQVPRWVAVFFVLQTLWPWWSCTLTYIPAEKPTVTR